LLDEVGIVNLPKSEEPGTPVGKRKIKPFSGSIK